MSPPSTTFEGTSQVPLLHHLVWCEQSIHFTCETGFHRLHSQHTRTQKKAPRAEGPPRRHSMPFLVKTGRDWGERFPPALQNQLGITYQVPVSSHTQVPESSKFLVFYLYVCLYTMCMPGAHRDQKSSSNIPGTGVKDGCDPPCGCWDFNSGPSEEQVVLLTTEPSLQTLQAVVLIHLLLPFPLFPPTYTHLNSKAVMVRFSLTYFIQNLPPSVVQPLHFYITRGPTT